jgi:hypothetical protein
MFLQSGVLCPAPFGYCALMARKLIGFDPETQRALELLSRDSEKSLQELADAAFADLLAKHRPRTFVEALKQISRPLRPMRTSLKRGGGLSSFF